MLTLDRQIDRRILLEADSLEEDGWSVSIISMPCEKHEESNDPRVFRIHQGNGGGNDSQASVNSRKLTLYNLARKLLSPNYKWVQAIRAFVRVHVFDSVGFYSELYLEELARRDFDVIVAHDLPMLPIAAAAAAEKQAKLVYDSHELFVEQNLPRYEIRGWERIEAKHIHACDAVITINQSIADELKKRYQLKDVLVVQNAEKLQVEMSEHPLRLFHDIFDLDEQDKVILLQGGLFSDRNLEVVVRALSYFPGNSIHLVFLGNGNGVPVLQRLVKELDLDHRVHFLPAAPQQELQKYTMSADLGIIPYLPDCLNNYYCTPNKLFEFVAAGLPVVASDLPEIRKIVIGHQIGATVDSSSEQSVVDGIKQVLADDEAYMSFKQRALQLRKTLNWQHEGERVIALYRTFSS